MILNQVIEHNASVRLLKHLTQEILHCNWIGLVIVPHCNEKAQGIVGGNSPNHGH